MASPSPPPITRNPATFVRIPRAELVFKEEVDSGWDADAVTESTDRIGQGTFGTVYKAQWNATTDATKAAFLAAGSPSCVVVKVLDMQQTNVRRQFLNEVSVLQKTKHRPQSLQFFGADEHQGKAYIVMEYTPLGDLRAFSKSDAWRALSMHDQWVLLCQAVTSIARIHDDGVVHRDIKPRNFLVFPDPSATPPYIVKVCDLGLSTALWSHASTSVADSKRTRAAWVGTAPYVAPELLALKVNGHHPCQDVYSLGMTLWTILIGQGHRPYMGNPVDFWKQDVVSGTRLPLSVGHLPEAWRMHAINLISECWHPDPMMRPTCTQVHTWMMRAKDACARDETGDAVVTEALGRPLSASYGDASNFLSKIIADKPLLTSHQVHRLLAMQIYHDGAEYADFRAKWHLPLIHGNNQYAFRWSRELAGVFYDTYHHSITDDELAQQFKQRTEMRSKLYGTPRVPPAYLSPPANVWNAPSAVPKGDAYQPAFPSEVASKHTEFYNSEESYN